MRFGCLGSFLRSFLLWTTIIITFVESFGIPPSILRLSTKHSQQPQQQHYYYYYPFTRHMLFSKNNNNNKNNDLDLPTSTTSTTTTTTRSPSIQPKTWNPFRLLVLRWGWTEPAMISSLNYGTYDKEKDTFLCAYCHTPLFDANAKYNSGSGWPSFWRTKRNNVVAYKREWDNRLECHCQNCSSHLGHVFMDGPNPSTVPLELLQSSPSSDPRSTTTTTSRYLPRFCINGAALVLQRNKKSKSTKDDPVKDQDVSQ